MKHFLSFLTLLLMACAHDAGALERITLTAGDEQVILQVEIADDPEERSYGLMHRAFLPKDQGMLFVFPSEEKQSFWMKNTQIPLDVLFFSTEGILVDVRTMKPCEKDPCLRYTASRPAKYALELNAGFYASRLAPLLSRSALPLRLLRSLEAQ